MEESKPARYWVWVVLAVVLFGLSLAGGYWYARYTMVEQASDVANVPSREELSEGAEAELGRSTGFVDVPDFGIERATEAFAFLSETYPEEIREGVVGVDLIRAKSPLTKEDYDLFQSADDTELSKVTLGCSWVDQGNVALIELYLDDEFVVETAEDPVQVDTRLRGAAFCVMSAVTDLSTNEVLQDQILTEMYDHLREQGWQLLAK